MLACRRSAALLSFLTSFQGVLLLPNAPAIMTKRSLIAVFYDGSDW